MSEFLNALSGGLGQGAVYAMLALGFVMIFKATRRDQLRPAGVHAVRAPCASAIWSTLMPFFLAVPLAVVLVGDDRAVRRAHGGAPMVGKPVFIIAIITIGVDIVVRVVAGAFIGVDLRSIGRPVGHRDPRRGVRRDRAAASRDAPDRRRRGRGSVHLLPIHACWPRHAGGRARSGSRHGPRCERRNDLRPLLGDGRWPCGDRRRLCGHGRIELRRDTLDHRAEGATGIIIGGLDSFGGAVIAGLLVGVVENVVATYEHGFPASVTNVIGDNFAGVTPYVLMLIVLLVRPYGLFGTKEVIRV